MLDVVEVEAGGREDAEVVVGLGAQAAEFAAEGGAARGEAPRYEGVEAASLVLQVAHALKVFDPAVHGLSVAVHHGGGATEPDLLGGPEDGDPLVGVHLERADAVTILVGQNLGAAAGQRALSGVPERLADLAVAEPGDLGHFVNLGGRPVVGGHAGKALAGGADHVQVVLERKLGIETALHKHGGTAHCSRRGDLGHHLFHGVGVGVVGLAGVGPVEGAERAVGVAEVGVVEVGVNHVGHDVVRMPAPTDLVGQRSHFKQRRVRQQVAGVGGGEPLAGVNLADQVVHHATRSTAVRRASSSRKRSKPAQARSSNR